MGKILAVDSLASGPDHRGLNSYVAILSVSRAEKGHGPRSGDEIAIRFHSSRTLDEVRQGVTYVFDCGAVNFQMIPGVAQDARVYALFDPSGHYVADYPESFFRLSRKEMAAGGGLAILPALAWLVAMTIGGVTGCLAFRLPSKLRRRRMGPIDLDPHAGIKSFQSIFDA